MIKMLYFILSITWTMTSFGDVFYGEIICKGFCKLIEKPRSASQSEFYLYDEKTKNLLQNNQLNYVPVEIEGIKEGNYIYFRAYKTSLPEESLLPGQLK